MTECSDSNDAPVDTTDDIIGAIDRVLGAENSDDRQIVSLKALSLESASNGDAGAPLSLGGDNAQKTKRKKNKKPKKALSSQGATNSGGLQGSPSPSARLATPELSPDTPILPSTPEGTTNDPVVVYDGGGSTSTELFASGVSDISQDENPFDGNNNNNDKETSETKDNQTGVTGDTQNSSGNSDTLVHPSPPGPLDATTPDGQGGPSGNAAISGSAASRSPLAGVPLAGGPPHMWGSRQNNSAGVPLAGVPPAGDPAHWETRTALCQMSMRPCIAPL